MFMFIFEAIACTMPPMATSSNPPHRSSDSTLWIHWLFLAGLSFVLFFYQLGSYPLLDVDEPRYAEAAREMLENGNWITPYFNYELRFDKPVFFYWLVALAYKVFGISEFSARFFSAVSGTAIVFMTYAFGRHWVSPKFALFAAAILATSIEVIGLSRMSITDMTLTALMTATIFSLFMTAHRSIRWWIIAGIFSGFAILTKGPVGIVVPGAILVFYALAIGQFKRVFLNRWFPLGILLAIGLSLPWYLLAYLQNGQIFIDALLHHNVSRYTDTVSGHDQRLYFFFMVLIIGLLPWSVFLPASVAHGWQELQKHHRQRVQEHNWVYLTWLFGSIWTVFILLFFTGAQTKLLTYILPLFPGAALALAATWYTASENTSTALHQWLTRSAWVLVLAVLIAGYFFLNHMGLLLPREAQFVSANHYNAIAIAVLFLGTSLMAWLITQERLTGALISQSITMACVGVVTVQGILPNISQVTQGPMLGFIKKAQNSPLATYELIRPSLTYYTRKKVPHFDEKGQPELRDFIRQAGPTYVVTKNYHVEELKQALAESSGQMTLVEQGPLYSLLTVSLQK